MLIALNTQRRFPFVSLSVLSQRAGKRRGGGQSVTLTGVPGYPIYTAPANSSRVRFVRVTLKGSL